MNKIVAVLVLSSALFVGYFVNKNLLVPRELPPQKDSYFGPGKKKADDTKIEKFTVNVSDGDLVDLRQRLEKTRFFDSLENSRFRYGINQVALKNIYQHWMNNFDWRKQEVILNKFKHFKTEIEGLKIHYIHMKPSNPAKYDRVLPLLIVHGWPGSVFEFYKLIPLLIDPPSGVPGNVAFEIIAPSIPGYGWSDKLTKQGFGPPAAARIFMKLMERLGHKRYYCQGGDWGSVITTVLAQSYPEKVIGLHLNMAVIEPYYSPILLIRQLLGTVFPYISVDPADYHKVYPMGPKFLDLLQESGYMHIQATKPDTVGFALNDSPMGLAAYILEKFSSWVNKAYVDLEDGGLTRHFSMDELLTNVMIYWTTGTIASSQRFYKECFGSTDYQAYSAAPVYVPTGVAAFPQEIVLSPRNHLEYKFTNITRYTDMPRGGHFAAFEEPKLMALDIIAFAADLEQRK